jgi:hypothetical protein
METTHGLGPQRAELIASVRQQPETDQAVIDADCGDAAAVQRRETDRDRVIDVSLAAVPLRIDPDPGCQLRWHVEYELTVSDESLGQRSASAMAPFNRPSPFLPPAAEVLQLSIAGLSVREPLASDHDLRERVHHRRCVTRLVRIDADHHFVIHDIAS